MDIMQKSERAASCSDPAAEDAAMPSAHDALIQLYGWDSRTSTWHGPNEIGSSDAPPAKLLASLRSVHGQSWYGPLIYCQSRDPDARFFALVHEFADSAVALIYCDDSKAGPAEILAVLPAERRPRLRPEFAFGFLAFARFLGAVDAGSELQVHDAMAAAVTEARSTDSVVFSISTGLWPHDREHVLSECVGDMAVTLLEWLRER
jgi:hypothetical protein